MKNKYIYNMPLEQSKRRKGGKDPRTPQTIKQRGMLGIFFRPDGIVYS